MKNKQRSFTVFSALLIIFALLLPIIGTMVAVEIFQPDIGAEPSVEENAWGTFFATVSAAVIMLGTLLVTCFFSCIAAGAAARLASSAATIAREEARSVVLPRILHMTAIVEVVVAVLVALFPLALLFRFMTL